MTNLALEGAACSTYSLYDANKDAAQLHKLSCKATLATAMIDQEIAELEKDLQVLEARNSGTAGRRNGAAQGKPDRVPPAGIGSWRR